MSYWIISFDWLKYKTWHMRFDIEDQYVWDELIYILIFWMNFHNTMIFPKHVDIVSQQNNWKTSAVAFLGIQDNSLSMGVLSRRRDKIEASIFGREGANLLPEEKKKKKKIFSCLTSTYLLLYLAWGTLCFIFNSVFLH